MSDTSTDVPVAAGTGEPEGLPWAPMPPAMIDVDQLTAHPGNVRVDLRLSAEFVASVAETGVRIPLLVVPEGDGYKVVEGHRRLAAAVKAGVAQVPCILDLAHACDEAGQFLDMLVANSGGYRQNLTPVEEAAALFAAHEAGASRTRIRKATGRKADEVKAALAVGGISSGTLESAGELAGQLGLDQLALLAEFDGDGDAIEKITTALRRGYGAEYTAERIRQDRAETAEHERLLAELETAGVAVTPELPDGAVRLSLLHQDGEEITPEAHASCPGRGAYFPSWNLLQPVHYCANPEQYGHAVPDLGQPDALNDAALPVPGSPAEPAAEGPANPDRRLVIEGNKAWRAAAEVRHRWLAGLFARRTAPRPVALFVTRQLLTMPDPLRQGLASAPHKMLFDQITGHAVGHWLDACDTAAAGRLPLFMLATVVTAYESAMTEGEGRNTWRTDRYSPCPPTAAGQYLTFLASIGHQLTAIEQALADGVPYTGDTPDLPSLHDADPAADDDGDNQDTDPAPGSGQDEASPEAA